MILEGMKALITLFLTGASAFASTVNLSLAADPSQYSTLFAIERLAPTADSTDRIFYHYAIHNDGPERSGYLQIQTGGGGFVTFSTGHLELGFMGGPINGVEVEASCGPEGCLPGNGYYGNFNRIPVTLGAPMALEAVGDIEYCCTIGPGLYFTGGSVEGTFQFRFFEADGVTPAAVSDGVRPVTVSDAPEPSTWGMLAAAGLGILGWRRQWR